MTFTPKKQIYQGVRSLGAMPQLVACGDRAVLIRPGSGIDPAVNARVHALAQALAALNHPALTEMIPAYDSLLVEYDPIRLRWEDLQRLVAQAAAGTAAVAPAGNLVEIPVLYGGEVGPDLDDVAAHTGLPTGEVIRRHADGTYRVYCLGFSPGFCYLGGLEPALATPRLADPRLQVPEGSVGIGGSQTGVYPSVSPGGWRLIGRTPALLFDPDRPQPSLVQPGDSVRFRPVDAAAYAGLLAARPVRLPQRPVEESGRPGLRVLSPGLLTTVQDLGRRGYQALGVPVGGAVDYWAVMVGNWLLGNRSRAAALEMTATGPEVEFTGPVAFCLTGAAVPAELVPGGGGSPVRIPGWMSHLAGPGDRLRIGTATAGCRTYLCVAGGVDVPPVLGSRSEDLFAGLGPFGRALQTGDWLPAGRPVLSPADLAGRVLPVDAIPHYHGAWQGALEVRVVLGPQADAFTPEGMATFLGSEYRISTRSDRQGARLEGPAVRHRHGADILSEGMPAGGIQVPADGKPILLLANRQTMGGYAKIAVALYPDVARVGQLRPGDTLRLRQVDLSEAHHLAWAERRELAQVRRYLEREAAGARRRHEPVGAPVAVAAPVPATVPEAPAPATASGPVWQFRVRIDALEFAVEVAEELETE